MEFSIIVFYFFLTLPLAKVSKNNPLIFKVTVPGMVDNFQKKYAALQIPYPSDNGAFKAIEDQAAEQKAAYNQFVAESNTAIEALKAEMSTFEAMKPVEEMNIEEALDAGIIGNQITGVPNPDVPSFWPHDESWEAYVERLKNAEDEEDH